ncbi:MAG: 4Fe-4S dicluster domain-containing protein [bacterium]
MKWFIHSDTLKAKFVREIEAESKTRIFHCYQCGKCSAGCPIAYEMDYTPNQIIRMIQLGMKDTVLSSNTIWLCASCITCSVRCPREIEIAEVMDVLRRIAYRRNIFPKLHTYIPLFNRIFLRNIELFGRLYEFGLIGMFNTLSGNFFKDFVHAPKMFSKGKINIFPARVKGLKELKSIFKNSGKMEKVRRKELLTFRFMIKGLINKLPLVKGIVEK